MIISIFIYRESMYSWKRNASKEDSGVEPLDYDVRLGH